MSFHSLASVDTSEKFDWDGGSPIKFIQSTLSEKFFEKLRCCECFSSRFERLPRAFPRRQPWRSSPSDDLVSTIASPFVTRWWQTLRGRSRHYFEPKELANDRLSTRFLKKWSRTNRPDMIRLSSFCFASFSLFQSNLVIWNGSYYGRCYPNVFSSWTESRCGVNLQSPSKNINQYMNDSC